MTWEKQIERKGSFFRAIGFVNDKVGFGGTVGTDYFPNGTDTIPLYKTVDGGESWNAVEYKGPYVKGICAIDILIEQYINHGEIDYKHHIFAIGRVGSPANIIISHDGGETWVSSGMNEDAKMLFNIKMFNKNEGIAAAASSEALQECNALILKTCDGGKTLKNVYQSVRPLETTWKISFPSLKIGYVTIQSYNPGPTVKQQRIAKTTDGGETWKEINLVEDEKEWEFGIGFIDYNTGFVATVNGGYKTTDGGRYWEKANA